MHAASSADVLVRLAPLLHGEQGNLDGALRECARAAGADFAVLLSVSPAEGKTWLLDSHGLSRPPAEKPAPVDSSFLLRRVTLSPDVTAQVLHRGWEQDRLLVNEGASSLLLYVHGADGIRFAVAAGRRGGAGFDKRTADLFALAAGCLGLAAERRHLRSELQKWRDRDPLTGLAVYHSFYEVLRREVSRARRQGGRVCLALFTVEGLDGRKGRKTASRPDQLLKEVAEFLIVHLRDNDVVGRYGPSEFGLLLADVNSTLGLVVAERLLRGVTEAFKSKGLVFRAGFAGYPEEAGTTERLIEMCEGALARAREEGGKKVVRWKK
jgi:diguanylate cyclase (GGDEF)-like protein